MPTLTLTLKPQYGHGARREWAIYLGDQFLAYSRSWTGANRAMAEIESRPKQLTQADIDQRPVDQEPQGVMRKIIWRAMRR